MCTVLLPPGDNPIAVSKYINIFISILYMFRAAMCPSSGELIVSIRRLVYVNLYRWPFGVQVWLKFRLIQTCTSNGLYSVTYTRCRIDTINSPDDGHNGLYSVTYTRCRIDTINSPDDGHMVARNM